MGVFIVTHAAGFTLHAIASLLCHLLHQAGQFEQAPGVQRRAPRRQLYECIPLHEIGPDCWNLPQMAAGIVKIYIAFGEDKTVLYQSKLLVAQRMKQMCDSNLGTFFSRIRCKRGVI
jgi:hypothetical protein